MTMTKEEKEFYEAMIEAIELVETKGKGALK